MIFFLPLKLGVLRTTLFYSGVSINASDLN